MPTILRIEGYRFYFYSHEPNEPPHVHIDKGAASLKAWLRPVALARNLGYRAHELNVILSLVREHEALLLELGMGILATAADERVADVRCDGERLTVDLMDGRTISAPLAWYPRLLNATPAQRAHWKIAGGGYGIHWPELDEDLSTEGLLRGAPAPRVA